MSDFKIILTDHAIADLRALPSATRDRIHHDIKSIEKAPFPSGARIKRLRGFRPPVYRLRSGEFRILYSIKELAIIVLRVIDRKLLDRIIKRLKLQLP